MLCTGKLHPDTWVAQDGGEAWVPLQQLAEQYRGTVTCPRCGRVSAPPLGQSPAAAEAYCPDCGEQLRPLVPGSVLSNMGFGCRHLLRFTGRATRREFWSMVLLSIFVIPVLHVVCLNAMHLTVGDEIDFLPMFIMGVCCIWALALTAFAALSARRLRDTGHNPSLAWGLGFFPLSLLVFTVTESAAFRMSSISLFTNLLAPMCFSFGGVFIMILLALGLKGSKIKL